jgi:y4mF family transcriptional regulator
MKISNFYLQSSKIGMLKNMIREHRRLSGLSQADLAKLAGVGKTVVFDLEHGKETIRYDTLTKILSALNITIRFESPLIERAHSDSARASSGHDPS